MSCMPVHSGISSLLKYHPKFFPWSSSLHCFVSQKTLPLILILFQAFLNPLPLLFQIFQACFHIRCLSYPSTQYRPHSFSSLWSLFSEDFSERFSLDTYTKYPSPTPSHFLLTLNFEYVKLNFASHTATLLYYGVSLLVYVFICLSCVFFTKVSAFHGKYLYLFSLLYLYFQ